MTSSNLPDERDALARAISKLQPPEREAFMLSAGEGLGMAEIAERLGISADSAERLVAHALCRIDRALERPNRPWWRFW